MADLGLYCVTTSGRFSCIRVAHEMMSIFRISKLSGRNQAGTSRAVLGYHIYTTHMFKLTLRLNVMHNKASLCRICGFDASVQISDTQYIFLCS